MTAPITSAAPAGPPLAFSMPLLVRFGDCDPVGIAYFPRYFDWMHRAMEAWFDEALGLPYAALLQTHGLPTVETSCRYAAPCRFGDAVRVELRLGRLGRSSLGLRTQIIGEDGVLRATSRTEVVMVDTRPGPGWMRPTPLPDTLRAKMTPYLDPALA
jgi:4-hydroxybenzoyl-CoA thioesterase